jgi:hypothetical protein
MNMRQTVTPMSEEAHLARRIEALIAKIVARKATGEDLEEYELLTKRRVDLMQPIFTSEPRREKVT